MPENVTISRADLFDRVWSKPMTQVAKDLKITCSTLRSRCERHEIPLPPIGHWSMLKNGFDLGRPEVNSASKASLETVRFRNPRRSRKAKPKEPEKPFWDTEIGTLAEKEIAEGSHIRVLSKSRKLHPLAERTRIALEKSYSDWSAFTKTILKSWGGGPGFLRVQVSWLQRSRAISFLDSLLKAMHIRGYDFTEIEQEFGPSKGHFNALEASFELAVTESYTRTRRQLSVQEQAKLKSSCFSGVDEYEYAGTGCFIVRFIRNHYSKREYRDKEAIPVEKQIGDMMVGILRLVDDHRREEAERVARELAEAEHRRIEQERQEGLRREAEKRQREQERAAAFLADAEAWKKACAAYEYIEVVRQQGIGGEEITSEKLSSNWLSQ